MYPMDWLDAYRLAKLAYEEKVAEAAQYRLASAAQARRPLGPRYRVLVAMLARSVALLGLGGLTQGR